MVDRWKKEVKLYNNNNLPLLEIKQFGPTFSGSGPFAYSHLHTSIKKSSYMVHHGNFRKLLIFVGIYRTTFCFLTTVRNAQRNAVKDSFLEV